MLKIKESKFLALALSLIMALSISPIPTFAYSEWENPDAYSEWENPDSFDNNELFYKDISSLEDISFQEPLLFAPFGSEPEQRSVNHVKNQILLTALQA
ncbi:MAG: hypothetical protein FWG90_04360 [Oscillospiraceae bacterium]|nr:hypothetical protein [Oscillospiraceae bacterium]